MADIQTLINNIPDAQDGNVITSDYHNTIKTALEAIGSQLGGSGGGQTVTLTLPPSFLPVPPITVHLPWNVGIGSASDAGGNLTDGWIPLHLPDGAVIQKVIVFGVKTAATTPLTYSATVDLNVMSVGTTSGQTLISVDLTNLTGNPFQSAPGLPLPVSGLGPTAVQTLQTVNNTLNKYVIHGYVNPSPGPATLTLQAIQVIYTTS